MFNFQRGQIRCIGIKRTYFTIKYVIVTGSRMMIDDQRDRERAKEGDAAPSGFRSKPRVGESKEKRDCKRQGMKGKERDRDTRFGGDRVTSRAKADQANCYQSRSSPEERYLLCPSRGLYRAVRVPIVEIERPHNVSFRLMIY